MHFPKVIADEKTVVTQKAQRQGRSRVTETTNSKRRRYRPLRNNDGEQNTFTDVRFVRSAPVRLVGTLDCLVNNIFFICLSFLFFRTCTYVYAIGFVKVTSSQLSFRARSRQIE